MKYRFHCLGIPHTISNKDYVACAYTQKVVKFCKMMKERGHHIIHYGHEDSDVICDEHVSVINKKVILDVYGDYDWKKNFFRYDLKDYAYQTFCENSIKEISKRKQIGDFLLCFWGYGHKPIADAHLDMIIVEPGIGYSGGHFARWRVYESYAIKSAIEGANAIDELTQDWYHVVIPNYFDSNDFQYKTKKEDYYLCLGRICSGKGVDIAIKVAQELNKKIVIAGQGSLKDIGFEQIPSNVEYIGYADAKLRKKLMANAKASFILSRYSEPFGGVQIENLFSGTPTITSDWGAFVENNLHGITGYRCRTFDHILWAAENIENIKSKKCREWSMNFTLEKVSKMYEEYFDMIYDYLCNDGWCSKNIGRNQLDWLHKNYPN